MLIVLIPIFAFPYLLAIWAPSDSGLIWRPKIDGIWQQWSNEPNRMDLGDDQPNLLEARSFSALGYALYFSLLSAFHIGWRDLNVGSWIVRIQPREYTLRARAGVQRVHDSSHAHTSH